jgi:hypothetical protein
MTPFWTNDVAILYQKNYLFEIIPKKTYDFNRKLNSLFRLSIYYSLILYVMNNKMNVLFIPFFVAIFSLFIHKNNKQNKEKELTINLMNGEDDVSVSELEGSCRLPTKDNPFMNPSVYGGDNDIEPCPSYNNKGIQREIESKFTEDLFRDVSDIFGNHNSQRQFYSVPGKTQPNDQETFAKWLYKTPKTCKEGNGLQCAANQYGGSGGGVPSD